jgi:hypothetical protein
MPRPVSGFALHSFSRPSTLSAMADERPAIPPEMAERVLRRASELSSDSPAADTGDWSTTGISERVLLEAAAEVGIEPAAVQKALALEKLGTTAPARFGDRILGPATVSADAETVWSPDDTLRLIDSWLVQAHHLRRERTRADGGEWRRRKDVAARVQRGLRGLNGEGRLGDSESVTATAVAVGTSRSLTRVTIDRSVNRTGYATAGGTVTAVGVAGSVVLAVLATPALIALAPIAAVGGVFVARSGKGGAQRSEREAQRMLDAVQRGEWPHSVSDDVRNAFRHRRR